MSERERISRHLSGDYTEPVRDPLWHHIYLSPPMLKILDTEPLQQLHRIKQLGPTYLVYPGATHTRMSHSLGVFHIAKRMVARLVTLPGAPDLTLEGVKAFLTAALLHDVGHFPYTHSFKRLPLAEHEELTAQIILNAPMYDLIKTGIGTDPEMTAAIVDVHLPFHGNREILLYRNLLSGSLDPDKLDYLNRDAYFCGVPYGIQDIDYALSRMVSVGYDGIGLELNALSAIENILFSKYLMYRAVYWHRTVRVATAMIKKAVYLGLQSGEIVCDDLYGLDDETFMTRIGGRTYPPFQLIERVGRRELLKPVSDVPYNPADPTMVALEPLDIRTRAEALLARHISDLIGHEVAQHEIIVDIPDAISFEVQFPVFDSGERREFSELSVFSQTVVSRFTETIRRLRVMVPGTIAEQLPKDRAFLLEVLQDAL